MAKNPFKGLLKTAKNALPTAKGQIDLTKPISVHYCIDTVVRDEQIAYADRLDFVGRIEPRQDRDDPIAIVGYGPSLYDTWQEAAKFPTVMTMSGSHKFMLSRGRTPDLHIDVDPRPHKVELMGPSQAGTVYYPASACHPVMFENLRGRDVRLWHVFTGKNEGFRILPFGEWCLAGGSGIGVRALTLARFLGYRNLHIFGLDGSTSQKHGTHAGDHPQQRVRVKKTKYAGRTFYTTEGMAEVSKEIWGVLNSLQDVRYTFYGDGLIQEMAKHYTRAPVAETGSITGVRKPPLSSPTYLRVQRQMHREIPSYGTMGHHHVEAVAKIAEQLPAKTVLDWACGKGTLGKALSFPVWEFDVAIPGKDIGPRPADLVLCMDTLEHIEESYLYNVLDELRRCTVKLCYATIALSPAKKVLPDGRNFHILLRPKEWWLEQLAHFFTVTEHRVTTVKEPSGYTMDTMHVFLERKPGAPPPGHQTVEAVRAGGPLTMGILKDDGPDTGDKRQQKLSDSLPIPK